MPHFPKPFYRNPRRRWYVQIGGKQINLGPDREKAFQRYHELMASSNTALPQTSSCPQHVAHLCDRFLEWVQTHRADPTYEGYRYRLQRFVDRYPSLTVDELRPFHVQEWADTFDISRSTKRNYMRSVKTCLRWCCKQGHIERSPIEHMDIPMADRKEVYISPAEFTQLLEHVSDSNLRDLLVTTYDVGCRPQESLRLERRHVEIENQRWVFPKSEAKGKKAPRVVYLSDRSMEITRRLMLRHPTGKLFRNSRGKPWSPDAVNSAFDRVRISMCKSRMEEQGKTVSKEEIDRVAATLNPLGRVNGTIVKRNVWKMRAQAKQKILAQKAKEAIPRYSLYALRHSWATNALKQGLDSLTVAILMGHQDPSMLAKVYQHLSHNPEHLLGQARRAAS